MSDLEHTYFIGVDVGTGSARAAVVDSAGCIQARVTRSLKRRAPQPLYYEQSSTDVWQCVCQCVREAVAKSGVDPADIAGMGFDATCSLVVLDADGQPLPVSPDTPASEQEFDIILWMDHRAKEETAAINATRHGVLDFVGGQMSPEMQMGKLKWLKQHNPQTWSKAGHFFDLPDYLTYKATGSLSRSLCSLVCKWTYVSGDPSRPTGFDPAFLTQIGLEDLLENGAAKLGAAQVKPPGQAVGAGLSPAAAEQLGLRPGLAVAAGSIDAHAGVLGVIAADIYVPGLDGYLFGTTREFAIEQRLALVLGTSSCHMAMSESKIFVPGVWGPYHAVVLPDYWLNEGGQSASGALLDHILAMHSGTREAERRAKAADLSIYDWLDKQAYELADKLGLRSPFLLCKDLHVLDSFHGNRSPLADPDLKGMIYGLELGSDAVEDLLRLYVAAVVSLALGTRQIVEAMNKAGHRIRALMACGGLCNSGLLIQAHADATGCRVASPSGEDAVLLGAAVLGAAASGKFPTLLAAAKHMNSVSLITLPSEDDGGFFERKYRVYKAMTEHQRWASATMAGRG